MFAWCVVDVPPPGIYIPLWSYSNRISCFNSKDTYTFTFHYGPIQIFFSYDLSLANMQFTFHYGPIQITAFISMFVALINIYIPLWSYSNLFRCHSPLDQCLIYIPLWSYSNSDWAAGEYRRGSFTFHYGPIQIRFIFFVPFIHTYLHSTMVLFKFWSSSSDAIQSSIYIPLWSYSNPLVFLHI